MLEYLEMEYPAASLMVMRVSENLISTGIRTMGVDVAEVW